MDFFQIIASLIFVAAYAGIALEHKVHLNKSAIALVAGGFLWLLAALRGSEHLAEEMSHAGSEVFSIVIFLLAAMSLVEILAHYRFFDILRSKLFALKLEDRHQFVLITILAFVLSAIVDNLTTTIIMIQISRKFFKGENLLIAASGVVIAANAGGAFSPIGDVTTIMLWFAKKFGTLEIILKGFLPSLSLWAVSTALLYRKLKVDTADKKDELLYSLSRSETSIVALIFLSFLLPVGVSFVGLPPYLGLLIGLGVVWLCVDGFKKISSQETHLSASIEQLIKSTDIPSLKFFVGILLAVSALHSLGVLEILAHAVYGLSPSQTQLIGGNIGLGILSSILDNVPLTAIAIQILQTTDTGLWVLLALSVGTGGSLLVIGSAAGVVAMGMVKELNFAKYFKIAFLPSLFGFSAAILVWMLQYFVFSW